MHYQRSLEIEQRLDTVLELIRSGDYSTLSLVKQIGVSIPTISRTVEALRERGHDIRSESGPNGSLAAFNPRPLTPTALGEATVARSSRQGDSWLRMPKWPLTQTARPTPNSGLEQLLSGSR